MKFPCPCCGYATFESPGSFEICEICGWQDDGQDNADADQVRGGANKVSLTEARRKYIEKGNSKQKQLEFQRRRIFEIQDQVIELKPDAFVDVELFPLTANPPIRSMRGRWFACPCLIGDEYFDCRIYLDNITLLPGESRKNLPIKFLFPVLVKPLLQVGQRLGLWHSGSFGSLTIREILL